MYSAKVERYNFNFLWKNVSSINDSATPIYYFARLFGFAPWKIPRHNNNNKVSLNLMDIIILLTFFSIFVYLIYWNINIFSIITNHTKSLILDIGGQVVLVIGVIISVTAFSLNFLFRNRIWSVLQKIYEFDNEVL